MTGAGGWLSAAALGLLGREGFVGLDAVEAKGLLGMLCRVDLGQHRWREFLAQHRVPIDAIKERMPFDFIDAIGTASEALLGVANQQLLYKSCGGAY